MLAQMFGLKKLILLFLFYSPLYAFGSQQSDCTREREIPHGDLIAVSFACPRIYIEIQKKQNEEWQLLHRVSSESLWTRDIQWVEENRNLYLQYVTGSPWRGIDDVNTVQIESKSEDDKYRLLRQSEKTDLGFKDILILQVKSSHCQDCWETISGIPRIQGPHLFSLEYREGELFARIGPNPQDLIKLLAKDG